MPFDKLKIIKAAALTGAVATPSGLYAEKVVNAQISTEEYKEKLQLIDELKESEKKTKQTLINVEADNAMKIVNIQNLESMLCHLNSEELKPDQIRRTWDHKMCFKEIGNGLTVAVYRNLDYPLV